MKPKPTSKLKSSTVPVNQTISVKWLSIDFGHVSTKSDKSDHADCSTALPSPQQQAILTAIPQGLRKQLCSGGTITVPGDPKNDEWVSCYLGLLLAPVLGVGVLEIREEDVVRLTTPKPEEVRREGESGKFWPWTSPDNGTHCRLVGERWINERTYRLYSPAVDGRDRAPWLGAALAGHTATATLVWVCRELAGTPWSMSE